MSGARRVSAFAATAVAAAWLLNVAAVAASVVITGACAGPDAPT